MESTVKFISPKYKSHDILEGRDYIPGWEQEITIAECLLWVT